MKKTFISLVLATMLVASMPLEADNVKWALTDLRSDWTFSDFHDGMAVFQNGETKLYGAMDTNKKIVIPATFTSLSDFSNGVAIVTSAKGTGIINKKGQYVYGPSNCTITQCFNGYEKDNKIPELYEIRENGQTAIYYKNTIVIPFSTASIERIFFPYIIFGGVSHKVINVETGHEFTFSESSNSDISSLFWDINGEETQGASIDKGTGDIKYHSSISSSGVKLTHNKNYDGYGFLDMTSSAGDTILKKGFFSYPYWVNDLVLCTVWKDKIPYLYCYDGTGKVVFSKKDLYGSNSFIESEMIILKKFVDSLFVYDMKGQIILNEGGFSFFTKITNNYYERDCPLSRKESYIFDFKNKKKYPYYFIEKYKNGVIIGEDNNSIPFILNTQNGKYISITGIDRIDIESFAENTILAKDKDYNDIVIDLQGNILIKCGEKIKIKGEHFSDGVLLVEDKEKWCYGYIYNPAIKPKFIYNQDEINDKLFQEAMELFNKGKYEKAKNIFYNIMINAPQDVATINNYGVCLEKLGYYDDAIDAYLTALEIDPNYENSRSNLEAAKQNKEIALQNQQYQYDNTMAILNGISSFLNILGDSFQQYASFAYETNNARESGYSTQSKTSSAHHTSGSSQRNDYEYCKTDQKTYSNYENQLIKMNTYWERQYNDKDRRYIQSQMRNIRQKWESKGYKMFHSPWEDWDGKKK